MWHFVLHYSLRTVTSMKGWCPMNHSNAFSHLTLEERRIILTGISNGSTKSAIAKTIGKDRSTVAKEIRLHRTLSHKCKMPLECNHYRKCVHGRQCTPDCPEYSPFRCSRRDRSPGACNGCSSWSRSSLPFSDRASPLTRSLPSIRNSTFLRRPSTITSSPVSSAKLPGSPPSTCAVRSAGSSPKRRPRSIRKERTGAICEAGPIRTIWPISHNTRMSSSFRWIRSITMDRTALSFRPLNSSRPAFSLPSIMKKRPLPP